MSDVQYEFKVQVNYRSGHTFVGWFTKFDVGYDGGRITSITFEQTGLPLLAFAGIADIESVVKLEQREYNVNE